MACVSGAPAAEPRAARAAAAAEAPSDPGGRQNQTLVARRVRAAHKRRADADCCAEPGSSENAAMCPTFTIYQWASQFSADSVTHLVFSRSRASLLSEETSTRHRRDVQLSIMSATLSRYMHHRSLVWSERLGDGPPHLVCSFRIKWDETEQTVAVQLMPGCEDVVRDGGGLVDRIRSTPLKVHIMVMSVWVFCRCSPVPELWVVPPARLERTTAENIWKGLARAGDFGPWRAMPGADRVQWLWLILTADEASSNLRLYAQSMFAARQQRERVCRVASCVHASPTVKHP